MKNIKTDKWETSNASTAYPSKHTILKLNFAPPASSTDPHAPHIVINATSVSRDSIITARGSAPASAKETTNTFSHSLPAFSYSALLPL